jgi:hypothetical protein
VTWTGRERKGESGRRKPEEEMFVRWLGDVIQEKGGGSILPFLSVLSSSPFVHHYRRKAARSLPIYLEIGDTRSYFSLVEEIPVRSCLLILAPSPPPPLLLLVGVGGGYLVESTGYLIKYPFSYAGAGACSGVLQWELGRYEFLPYS